MKWELHYIIDMGVYKFPFAYACVIFFCCCCSFFYSETPHDFIFTANEILCSWCAFLISNSIEWKLINFSDFNRKFKLNEKKHCVLFINIHSFQWIVPFANEMFKRFFFHQLLNHCICGNKNFLCFSFSRFNILNYLNRLYNHFQTILFRCIFDLKDRLSNFFLSFSLTH